jgi:hypothetical protein
LAATLIDIDGAISGATEALRENLRSQQEQDLNRRLRQATGRGAANAIDNLIAGRVLDMADAVVTGVSAALVSDVFAAEVRAALSGSSLADLQSILASGAVIDDAARAILNLVIDEQALAQTRQEELVGLRELASETQRFATAAGNNARALRQAAAGFLTDARLSPLSPLDRLSESQRQIAEAIALATDDDPFDAESQDAIRRLPELIRTDNELARDFYASSEAYQERFNRNQEALNSIALQQETIEQQQLSQLVSIEARIGDVVAAISGLQLGVPAVGGGGPGVPAPEHIGGGTITAADFVARQNDYLAKNPDVAAGISQGWFGSGYDHWLNVGQFEAGRPAFHTGGFPEPGSTFRALPNEIMVHAPSMGQLRVFDPQTSAGMRASNDDGRLSESIDRLADRVDRLIMLTADSGEANAEGLAVVAAGVDEVRQALRRTA